MKKPKPRSNNVRFMKRIPEGATDRFAMSDDGDVVFAGESQYDPGFFTLRDGVDLGSLLVIDGYEHFCVKVGYTPGGSGHTMVLESDWQNDDTKLSDLPGVAYDCERIDVDIDVEPAVSKTGVGGVAPARPHLFDEGQYDVWQGASRVGLLLVEHSGGNQRVQYWFLFTEARPGSGRYVFPGAQATSVVNTIEYSSAFTPTMDLDTLRGTLPPHVFLRGTESYHSTLSGNV